MPKTPTRTATKKRVLARLARADMALLKPHLAPVDLPVSTQLETANARIDTVYFMERGFASGSPTVPASEASRSASLVGKA